jgi:hypothetical protein
LKIRDEIAEVARPASFVAQSALANTPYTSVNRRSPERIAI